jgi:hypothetical protein
MGGVPGVAGISGQSQSGRSPRVSAVGPYLKDVELEELIADTELANKSFSQDQSAMVLELPLRENRNLNFRFLGCDDDLMGQRRLEERQAKNAASKRKSRAARSTGRKAGRPRLELSEEDRRARSNAQAAERMRLYRALRKTPSPGKIRKTRSVTQFNVTTTALLTTPQTSSAERVKRDGAVHRDILVGEILDRGGYAGASPPSFNQRTWEHMAVELFARPIVLVRHFESSVEAARRLRELGQ